jgi:cytochrome c biogenesis protein CcdA
MIGKISPLVQVAGRTVWFKAATLHTLGLGMSGWTLGLVLGLAGAGAAALLGAKAPVVAWAAFATICAARDLHLLAFRIPDLYRQAPESWRCVFGAYWGAFLWGLDLGQGWTVRIPFATFFALIAWVLISGDPWSGALIFAAYAIGKALPVCVFGLLQRPRAGHDYAFECLVQRPWATRVIGIALALVAGAAFAVGMTA